MTESIQLKVLRCPECSANLTGEKEGVLLYCKDCGSGFRVLESELSKVPVYFARMSPKPEAYLPFWAFDATLELHNVEAKKSLKSVLGSRGGLIRQFEERGSLRLYVSAFAGDLDVPDPRALGLSVAQPNLEYISPMPAIEGFTVSLEDAEKVADYLFLTSEIEEADMMRNLQYSLHLANPIVVVIGL